MFQITYKGRGSIRNFEGSIDVDLFKSSQVDHLFCWVMFPALSGFWPETPLLSGTVVNIIWTSCSAVLQLLNVHKNLCQSNLTLDNTQNNCLEYSWHLSLCESFDPFSFCLKPVKFHRCHLGNSNHNNVLMTLHCRMPPQGRCRFGP